MGLERCFQLLGAVTVTALRTGCAGAGSSAGLNSACSQLIAAPPTLVNPSPGAGGVPDNIGTIVLAGAITSETVSLVTQAGTVVAAGALQAQAGGNSETASVPPLSATTTYSVKVSGIPAACGTTTSQVIGAFTTS
jgi:hypothetical protein